MAKTDAIAFWTVFLIILFINILVPLIAVGFQEEYNEYNTEGLADSPPTIADYFGISALNLLLVPFWTLGMPTMMNLFIMLPLRVLAWILILRLIRGN